MDFTHFLVSTGIKPYKSKLKILKEHFIGSAVVNAWETFEKKGKKKLTRHVWSLTSNETTGEYASSFRAAVQSKVLLLEANGTT